MTKKTPWFNAKCLPATPTDAYVAWLDVMGARSAMLRSLPVSANFIFKLHVAALEAVKPSMRLYPVMDGVFVVATALDEMRAFLISVFTSLADGFVDTAKQEHRFLTKCAVAYGPIINGSDVKADASNVFKVSAANETYKNSVLLGIPIVYAAQSEPSAPPFGVYVHGSASDFLTAQERKRSSIWWPWYKVGSSASGKALRKALPDYFDWCEARAGLIGYEVARIREHRAQADQYLIDA